MADQPKPEAIKMTSQSKMKVNVSALKKAYGVSDDTPRDEQNAKPLHQHIKENYERLRETLFQTAEWARNLSVS